jgi:glycosyltransferase involved in cell wall biosynthesis
MSFLSFAPYRIAAIVPCHNEEQTVGAVVRDLLDAVPGITVFVYDNRSTDRTVEEARKAGAVVCREPLKGKGNVVRRAFADIEADIYLMIDGDDTYDASAAPRLIEKLIEENLDHVVGVRKALAEATDAYRPNHEMGNKVLNKVVAKIFGDSHDDMLSGYRVFSRRFVKSFPAVSREFEIETELTVHSLALRIPTATVEVDFKERPEGSESKLRTYRDGSRILSVIISLARYERPVAVHGLVALLFVLVAAAIGVPALVGYAQTGYVDRLPSLLTAGIFTLGGMLAMASGLSLDANRKGRHETSRLAYLTHSSVRSLMNTALTDRLVDRFADEDRDADLLATPAAAWDRREGSALAAFENEVKVRVGRTTDAA